jgi:ADP-dependent NAD(P)H-hydrate dehydratase
MLPAETVTPELLRSWPLPQLDDGASKHDRGTIHVVGGALGTPGAVLLAGLAALRVGGGRLTLTTAEPNVPALAVAVPEAMVNGSPATHSSLSGCDLASEPDAFVVGPGLTDPGKLVRTILKGCGDAALVLDAGALKDLPRKLPARTVLTPNTGELRALGGKGDGESAARSVSRRHGAVVVVLEGVAAPDGRWWRSATGSASIATSGSGDVLAGVIGGLLARGAEPEQAACWGQYLHAAAGERLGRLGFLARELLDVLPDVLHDVERP